MAVWVYYIEFIELLLVLDPLITMHVYLHAFLLPKFVKQTIITEKKPYGTIENKELHG